MRQSDFTKRQNIITICGIILAFAFIPLAGTLLFGRTGITEPRIFYSRLLHWFTVGLLFLYAYKIERRCFLLWEERYHPVWFYLASVFGLFVISILLSVIALLPKMFGYHDDYTLLLKMTLLMKHNKPLMLIGVITAGICEEMIVRGYILTRLSLLFKNIYWPIILSAAMFSALHLGYHNLHEVLFTFLFGILTGSHYYKYRSILALILFHVLFDMLAFTR